MKNSNSSTIRINRLLAFATLFLVVKFSAVAAVDHRTAAHATHHEHHRTAEGRTFGNMSNETAMDRVNSLMRRGRSFRYTHSEPYRAAAPEVTARRRAGDCKDKALWLMDQLHDQHVRYVIGRLDRRARVRHAWLVWEHDGQSWILDCTMHSRAIPANRVRAGEYIPDSSLSKNSAYRRLVRNPA